MTSDGWDSFRSEAAEGWDKIKNDFSDGWDNLKDDFEDVKVDGEKTADAAADTAKGVDEGALRIGDTVPFSRPVRHMDANTEGFWNRDGQINYDVNGTKKFEKVAVDEAEPEEAGDMEEFDEVQSARMDRGSGRGGNKKKNKSNASMIIAVIVALVLVVGIVILIAALINGCDSSATPTQENTTPTVATTANWELNGDVQVTELINRYYAARTLVDTYSLSELLDPSVVIDESALANEASVVDEYKDISVYTTPGMQPGEWAAYVGYKIKFKNIATVVPGLDATYVKTDANGALRLLPYEAVISDPALNAYVAGLGNCDAITELCANVDAEYRKAITSDDALYNFIKSIGGKVDFDDDSTDNTSGDTTAAPEDTTAAPEDTITAPEDTTTAPPETTTAPAADDTLTECDDIMYVNRNDVNMRDKASTDGEVISSLSIGTKVHVMAKGSSWAKIARMSDGKVGYCSLQFLQGDPLSAGN